MQTYGLRSSAAALFLILASSSYAATYAVNSTGDAGDGVCDASCTLRDAIIAANTGSGQDTIDFSDITAAVPVTIALASGPLLITESMIMDASITETRVLPGNPTRRPGVELTGIGSGPGLVLVGGGASYSEIRGMVINNFEEGIVIDTSDHNTIAGNYFGSTVDGVENDGTLVNGVLVFESNNTMIGGSGANDRNIFLDSGENGTAAVNFLNFGFNGNNTTTNDNQVINNYFSLNVVGETAPDLGPPFVSWFDAVSFQMRPVGSSCSNCKMSGNKILHNRIKHIIFGVNYGSHVPIIDNPNPGENIKIAHNLDTRNDGGP